MRLKAKHIKNKKVIMKIKRFNENIDRDQFEDAKEFVREYIKSGSEMSMEDYYNFYFEEMTGVHTELINSIKALCSNLYLDSKDMFKN